MGVKQLIYLIVFIISFVIVSATPVPDYTLYGSATVSGKILTKEDTNVISLRLNEQELVKFTMGDVAADAYVLRVQMDSERTEGRAMKGDSVRIYIDGKEIDQSPVTIGDFGITVKLDITVSGTPSTCSPNWQCGAWESCSASSTQSRTCTDLNNCGTASNKPAISQPCTPPNSGSGGSSGGSGSGSSSKSNSKETPKVTETISVNDNTPAVPTTQKAETVKKTVIKTAEENEPATQQISSEEQEEKVSLLQKIKDLFGFGKEMPITGEAVADVPTPRPLVGILIALVIVAFGLLVAYVIIFKLS
jgi:hypothetical protein